MSETALVIIARYPEEGKGKTRLARTLGTAPVKELYQAFLSDLARRFVSTSYPLYWAYTPATSAFPTFATGLVEISAASKMHYFPQQGEDLGERLHKAFTWTYQHGITETILIGSDTPHISLQCIEKAQEALQHADVVLGPAEDGGYYLIAMREPHDVFSGITMSTSQVLEQTIAAAERQGLRVAQLDPLFDIDEPTELQRLAEILREDPTLAPETASTITHIMADITTRGRQEPT